MVWDEPDAPGHYLLVEGTRHDDRLKYNEPGDPEGSFEETDSIPGVHVPLAW